MHIYLVHPSISTFNVGNTAFGIFNSYLTPSLRIETAKLPDKAIFHKFRIPLWGIRKKDRGKNGPSPQSTPADSCKADNICVDCCLGENADLAVDGKR